jgi:hypothetical protein
MRVFRLLLVVAWLALAVYAQDGPAKLLLRNQVHVRGFVVDGARAPISDVRIDHIALTSDFATTDSSGHFEFEAKGSAVVFRKKGWASRLVRVTGTSGEIRIVLDRTNDPEPLPNCNKKIQCGTTPLGNFCFPKVHGVRMGESVPTLDTLEQRFSIHAWLGPDKTMFHGAAPNWGGPEPLAREIWDSVEFSEVRRDSLRHMVLDSRGKTSDGKLWRAIGQSGESVSYFGQDLKDAMLFDRVLDGLCVLVPDR